MREGRPTTLKAFADDLRAALELSELSYARRFDADFRAGGGVIVYAIDSAILNHLFAAPQEDDVDPGSARGRTKAADQAYQIFRGPGPVRRTLRRAQDQLRNTLLWYLADGRSPVGAAAYSKLIVMPGHSTELRNLYDAIVAEFDEQGARSTSLQEAARGLAELYEAGGDGQKARQEKLRAELSRLALAIGEPHDKFDRINSLMRRRQVLGLGAAAADPDYQVAALQAKSGHAFRQVAEPRQEGRVGSLSWWRNELHDRIPAAFAAIDREALAALDRVNRALDPTRARVVMFTDNQEIIEVGRGYKPLKGHPDEQLGNLTFSDLYLRHPTSLLVDPAFMRPGASSDDGEIASAQDVDGWLRTLVDESLLRNPGQEADSDEDPDIASRSALTRWMAYRRDAPSLKNRIGESERLRSALSNNPALHTRFAQRWADHLDRLTSLYQAGAPAINDKLRDLSRHFKPGLQPQLERFVEDLRTELRRLAERSWSTFFNTAADTGLELISLPSPEANPAVWPTPPLHIEGHAALRQIVEIFHEPMRVREDAKGILQRLNATKTGETQYDNYLQALCYGLLFAYAERWRLTRLLALRARQIYRDIRTSPDPNEEGRRFVTGREAAYLLAVANRVTARTPEHLQAAGAALDDADEAQKKVVSLAKDTGTPESSGIRLEAERIAIDIASALALIGTQPFDEPQARALRMRTLSCLLRTPECGSELVRTHVRVQLRSDYFHSLLLPYRTPPGVRYGGDHDPLVVCARFIPEQLVDLEALYGRAEAFPYRDRAVLRLAAATLGRPSILPAALQEPTVIRAEELNHAFAMQHADRRRLARIERTVTTRLFIAGIRPPDPPQNG